MASDRVTIGEKCTCHRRADDTHVRRVFIVTRRDRAARQYRNAHCVEETGADHEAIEDDLLRMGVRCLPKHSLEVVIDLDGSVPLLTGMRVDAFFR